MIPASEFIVVEFDLHARFIRKTTLWEFNKRRKEEFKCGYVSKTFILMGVFETEKEADDFKYEFNNIDLLIEAVLKGEDPFQS